MRKIVFTALSIGLLWTGVSYAQTNPATSITPGVNTNNTILKKCDSNKCYELLEVLPSADNELPPLESIDTTSSGSDGIGGFINFIFQIGLGVAGVIGVVMLTVYGFQYAANDKNVQTFAQLKEKILGVVMGLLLLLGIFVILKTINPDLLIVEPKFATLSIEVESTPDNTIIGESVEELKGNPEVPNSGKGFALKGTFENPIPSAQSTNLIAANKALKAGAKITKLFADVGTGSQTNGTLYIYLSNGLTATAPIRTGYLGVAERGKGVSKDHKTPKGDWKIMQRMAISPNSSNAVLSNSINKKTGQKNNFGPAFLNYTPRATGLHGKADNTLGTTEGCLRLYNDDLLLIAPFIYQGLDLRID